MSTSDSRPCCPCCDIAYSVDSSKVRIMRKGITKKVKCTWCMPAHGWKEDSPEELGVLLFYYAVILEVIL